MKIIKIEDINDTRLDYFYRQKEKELAFAYDEGYFIGESELVINRALDQDFEPLAFLIQENSINEFNNIFSRLKEDTIVYEVKQEIFNKLKGFILIKGILCLFKRKKELDYLAICKNAERVVVLEEVENPTNIGAIFRNAAALNADGILLTDDCSDPLYRRSIRVSMGNVFNIKYAYIPKDKYIDYLHELGFKTVALALRDDAKDIDDELINNEEKLAIILGSEGYGICNENIKKSDYVVKIKMNEQVDSLNVASCSGIALWQLCQKKIK